MITPIGCPRLALFVFALGLLAPTRAAETVAGVRNLVAIPAPASKSDARPAWRVWSPRPELEAETQVLVDNGEAVLSLQSKRFEGYGQWVTQVEGIEAGKFYRFEALHRSVAVESPEVSLVALLTWWRGPGEAGEIQRDYAEETAGDAGWGRSVRLVQAPAGAKSVSVQLGLRWTRAGSVQWKHISLAEAPPPAPRKVRIATTYYRPPGQPTLAANTLAMAEILDAAGRERPDIVLFSENLVDRGVRLPLAERAQTIPGPLTAMLGEKARAYHTYVVTTLHERDGDLLYNTAVLIDREGRLAGKYRKVHLAMSEADAGLTPGSDYPIFDTDVGRIGLLTCWDNWFSESARIMRLKGAGILLVPLAGDGVPAHFDAIMRARALDNGLYVVSSATVMEQQSLIVNPAGEVLASADKSTRFALAEIDLNQEWRVRYLSVSQGLGEARSLYLKERRPDTYAPLTEAAKSAPSAAVSAMRP